MTAARRAKPPSKVVIVRRWEPLCSRVFDAVAPHVFGVLTRLDGLRTARGKNARANWRQTYARNQAERGASRLAIDAWFGGMGTPSCEPPYVVTLTRVAPSAGLDDDNLTGALAYVRDGVADALGTGDGLKAPVTWKYAQRRGPWGVEIRIEWGVP